MTRPDQRLTSTICSFNFLKYNSVTNVEHFLALDSQSRKVKGETSSQKNEVNRQHIHAAFLLILSLSFQSRTIFIVWLERVWFNKYHIPVYIFTFWMGSMVQHMQQVWVSRRLEGNEEDPIRKPQLSSYCFYYFQR